MIVKAITNFVLVLIILQLIAMLVNFFMYVGAFS
jgi:hypothetical protein